MVRKKNIVHIRGGGSVELDLIHQNYFFLLS